MPKIEQPEYVIIDDLSSKDSADLAAGLERSGWVQNRSIEKFADKLTISQAKTWSEYLIGKGVEVLVTKRLDSSKRQVWKRVKQGIRWK